MCLSSTVPVGEDLVSGVVEAVVDGGGDVGGDLPGPAQSLIVVLGGLQDGVVGHEVTGRHSCRLWGREGIG